MREKTDALDAAGNTTAAIGKGFAIGSACLVGVALFGAFVTRLNDTGAKVTVDLLDPLTFAGLLVGSMLPYWFSAMTMKSVGKAANEMVIEIKRQFDANPNLLIPNHPDRPDYDRRGRYRGDIGEMCGDRTGRRRTCAGDRGEM